MMPCAHLLSHGLRQRLELSVSLLREGFQKRRLPRSRHISLAHLGLALLSRLLAPMFSFFLCGMLPLHLLGCRRLLPRRTLALYDCLLHGLLTVVHSLVSRHFCCCFLLHLLCMQLLFALCKSDACLEGFLPLAFSRSYLFQVLLVRMGLLLHGGNLLPLVHDIVCHFLGF